MKRPHRRIHYLLWLVLAPVTFAAGIYVWVQRPQTPYTEFPESIETIDANVE